MIGHIRSHFKQMHNLYLVMKHRNSPTEDEILMASGKKTFDDSVQAEYLRIIETEAAGIKEAFEKQTVVSRILSINLLIVINRFSSLRNHGIKINSNNF